MQSNFTTFTIIVNIPALQKKKLNPLNSFKINVNFYSDSYNFTLMKSISKLVNKNYMIFLFHQTGNRSNWHHASEF